MAVQIAEAMKAASGGDIIVTVEESQGSVQNVMEAKARGGDYVFTTPPVLVKLAQGGKAMFKDKTDPKFDEIRALFPIPSLTMHFVMSEGSGVKDFSELEGKKVLIGKGSFGAREGAKYLKLFGLEGKVDLADVELSNAVPALKNGQIDGFVTAGSWPAPNVIEAAASTGVTVLSLDDDQIAKTKRTKLVIPAGTYSGQKADITTTSLPVVAYTTTAMDDETAYQLTKTYWEQKAKMGEGAAWWNGVDEELLSNIIGKIHPGAVRYYEESGVALTDDQR
jgi:TRAP transporter TAXI family solute receptor